VSKGLFKLVNFNIKDCYISAYCAHNSHIDICISFVNVNQLAHLISYLTVTRDTAVAVGRTHRMFIAPLREIILPPFNKVSNSASHMQINAAVSEIQRST